MNPPPLCLQYLRRDAWACLPIDRSRPRRRRRRRHRCGLCDMQMWCDCVPHTHTHTRDERRHQFLVQRAFRKRDNITPRTRTEGIKLAGRHAAMLSPPSVDHINWPLSIICVGGGQSSTYSNYLNGVTVCPANVCRFEMCWIQIQSFIRRTIDLNPIQIKAQNIVHHDWIDLVCSADCTSELL